MKYRAPYGYLFLSIALLLVLHIAGIYLYLYWRIPEYNRLVHIAGSTWVSYVIILNIVQRWSFKKPAVFIMALVCSLVVGVGWELFEVSAGLNNLHDKGYWYDTIADLISDVIGGLIVGTYFSIKKNGN